MRFEKIATLGDRAAWYCSIDGQVAIAPEPATFDINGVPNGARWESSLENWERYFESVRAPLGWARVPEAYNDGEGKQ